MQLWIGLLDKVPLVFDKEIQLEGCPHVFLWNAEAKQMQKYVPSMIRSCLRKNDNSFNREVVEDAYLMWKRNESVVWLEEQKTYYSERAEVHRLEVKKKREEAIEHEERMQVIAERHKQHMANGGLQYQGFMPHEGARRLTHCWSCHSALDSRIDIACNSCRWLICECGACGCGAPRRRGDA